MSDLTDLTDPPTPGQSTPGQPSDHLQNVTKCVQELEQLAATIVEGPYAYGQLIGPVVHTTAEALRGLLHLHVSTQPAAPAEVPTPAETAPSGGF